jgi:tetratricopeptide (TPR) repeat protein
MAKRKEVAQVADNLQDDTLVDISQVGSQATALWDKYGKIVTYVGGGLLLLIAGYLAYKNLYVAPKQKEAVNQMYQAQAMFERDSFDLALNNPGGGNLGFLDVINQFGATPAGNSAKYYAGICYLNLGKFDEAIKQLEDFKCEGSVLPIMKHSALGDAYSELGNMAKAADAYDDAVDAGNNDALTPLVTKKLAMLKENQNDKASALKLYQSIKEKYPQSIEAMDVDKFIIRTSK